MPHYSTAEEFRARGLRFVRRIHRMRMVGTILCALPIASVLQERDAGEPLWVLLVLNAFVWPQVADWLCRRSRDPVATEFRCLMLDSAFGGAWIAAMAVSAAPAAVFVTMLTADKIAAGGWGLLRRSTVALVLGFALAWTAMGFPFEPAVSQRTLLACVPFLFVYAVTLSVLTHRLGRRIAKQNRELEHLSRTDPIMQLPNRPYFEIRAFNELSRFKRSGHPATLLLIDIDHFKPINDRYGHGMGDVVLKRVADVLRASVRDIDLPARYGGDEFAMLLVDTNTNQALQAADRLRIQISELVFEAEPGLRCSSSIGLAELSKDHDKLDQWIQAADAALYRAKAAGRNRVASA
jgi:diguanylate cyclase